MFDMRKVWVLPPEMKWLRGQGVRGGGRGGVARRFSENNTFNTCTTSTGMDEGANEQGEETHGRFDARVVERSVFLSDSFAFPFGLNKHEKGVITPGRRGESAGKG